MVNWPLIARTVIDNRHTGQLISGEAERETAAAPAHRIEVNWPVDTRTEIDNRPTGQLIIRETRTGRRRGGYRGRVRSPLLVTRRWLDRYGSPSGL